MSELDLEAVEWMTPAGPVLVDKPTWDALIQRLRQLERVREAAERHAEEHVDIAEALAAMEDSDGG